MSKVETIKVVCRFRGGQGDNPDWQFMEDGKSLIGPKINQAVAEPPKFTFDKVLNSNIGNEEMYNVVGRENILKFM